MTSVVFSVPTSMTFPLKPIIHISGSYGSGFLTDHNRSELSVSFDEIGNTERTVMGTMRGYVVTRKRTFDLSWDDCPADAAATVDGYWSGKELLDFYNNTYGSFTIKLFNRNNVTSSPPNVHTDANPLHTVTVRINSFDYEVKKRNATLSNNTKTDFWRFSLSLEEI